MKRWMTITLATTLVLGASAPVDAAKRKAPKKPHSYVAVGPRYENPNSPECIRARSQDPAGNYRHYPCWARAALTSPSWP